jgi:O-acetyl-ADP-ribose deacetylase (regulator of RNase III)
VNLPAFSTDFSLSSHQEFIVGNIKVVVRLQNITAVNTDGLVNAANGSLCNAAGVAAAISKAADVGLETECEDFSVYYRHNQSSSDKSVTVHRYISPVLHLAILVQQHVVCD